MCRDRERFSLARDLFAGTLLHGSENMRSLILAGVMMFGATTACFADGLYWVVGNLSTGKCDIVTSNPVITGDIWFEDGPYNSLADAKLARSTITVCPEKDPTAK
jgi:hypothetical protein